MCCKDEGGIVAHEGLAGLVGEGEIPGVEVGVIVRVVLVEGEVVLIGGREEEESALGEVQLREGAGGSSYLLYGDLVGGSNGPVPEVVGAVDEKGSYQDGCVAPLG